MRLDTIAFGSDGSEFSKNLRAELKDSGWLIEEFERTDDLVELLQERCAGIVIVNPHLHQARAARSAMQKTGGITSKIPLVAALSEIELVAETDMLRRFDDFIVKPAGAVELGSRIAVNRARRGKEGEMIECGDLTINLDAHQVICDGMPVDLTYKEYELLKELASRRGRVHSRQELLRNIWGYDYFGGTRTVDVHIRRLRSKIEGSRQYIETVHGVGYRFTSD